MALWEKFNATSYPTRAAWREARSRTIGASESAAILGVSHWKSALELFHEKLGTAPPNKGESFARDLGLLLEDPIAEMYRQKTGRIVARPVDGEFIIAQHQTHPHMVATLDGVQVFKGDEADEDLRDRPGVLEIKTAAISKAAVWTHEAPIDYQVQVQHQLACTGVAQGSIVALVGGVMIRYSDIKRDQAFIDLLEAAVSEFWRRFELNDPPPPDGTEATKAFLKRLYAREEPTSIALPPEAIEWDAERERAKAEKKAAGEREQLAENRILSAIGANTQGVLPNGVVFTLKTQQRQAYTVQPTSFRVLRRKDGKSAPARKGSAPKLDTSSIREQFENEQALETSVVEDFEL